MSSLSSTRKRKDVSSLSSASGEERVTSPKLLSLPDVLMALVFTFLTIKENVLVLRRVSRAFVRIARTAQAMTSALSIWDQDVAQSAYSFSSAKFLNCPFRCTPVTLHIPRAVTSQGLLDRIDPKNVTSLSLGSSSLTQAMVRFLQQSFQPQNNMLTRITLINNGYSAAGIDTVQNFQDISERMLYGANNLHSITADFDYTVFAKWPTKTIPATLRELHLGNLDKSDLDIIIQFLVHAKQSEARIQSFSATVTHHLENPVWRQLIQALPFVEELVLNHMPHASKGPFTLLFFFSLTDVAQTLRKLSLEGVRIQPCAFEYLISELNLTSLTLKKTDILPDQVSNAFSTVTSSITHLTTDSTQIVSLLDARFPNVLRGLLHLDISLVDSVSPTELGSVLSKIARLKMLDLGKWVTEAHLKQVLMCAHQIREITLPVILASKGKEQDTGDGKKREKKHKEKQGTEQDSAAGSAGSGSVGSYHLLLAIRPEQLYIAVEDIRAPLFGLPVATVIKECAQLGIGCRVHQVSKSL